VLARRQAGNPIEKFDALIAATTLAAGASIATRDGGGFDIGGQKTQNPYRKIGRRTDLMVSPPVHQIEMFLS
jgi:hypothetical protein